MTAALRAQNTALSAGPETPFPTAASNSFEGTPTGVNPMVLGPWFLFPSSGVDDGTAGILGPNQSPPDGTQVAWLQGGGRFGARYLFPAGAFRLRFQAADSELLGGTGLQAIRVSIGSTRVFEAAPDGTSFAEYQTRPVVFDAPTLTFVSFEGVGPTADHALLDSIELEPISRWDDNASWSLGHPPGTNDLAVIPADVEVAITGASKAFGVEVLGELLAAPRDLSLDTHYVRLGDHQVDAVGGLLEVGTLGAPFEQDFALRLLSASDANLVTPGGTKCLVATNGGRIELHGAPKKSWTHLALPASDGDLTITVDDASGWQKDDQIVLSGTFHQHSFQPVFEDNSEVAVIDTVVGNVVTLTAGLQFDHFAGPPSTYPPSTREVDLSGEVGMLSHNVRVEGVLTSGSQFGAHVLVHRHKESQPGGRCGISHVELHNVGQFDKLGRYPIHWHMQLDDGAGQYFVDSSIHESFNRAATIHGTESVRFERNVAYRHIGHGIFLEDGSERFNEIHDNLALSTLRPANAADALIPTDFLPFQLQSRSPSTYWIANPTNNLSGNVAAGTVGTGFWLAFPERPTGLSAATPYFVNQDIRPLEAPMGQFEDNACHSSGTALDVNDSFHPTTLELLANADWLPPFRATFVRFSAWGCTTGIYTGESHGDLVFWDTAILDCGLAFDFAGFHEIVDSLVVANSNTGFQSRSNDGIGAYQLYHAAKMRRTQVTGFDQHPYSVLRNRGGAQKPTNHEWEDITFVPAAPQYYVIPDFSQPAPIPDPREWSISIRDVDGDVTPAPGMTIISNHPMMRMPLYDQSLPAALFPAGPERLYASPFKFGHLRIFARRNPNANGNGGGNPSANVPHVEVTRFDRSSGTAPVTFDYPDLPGPDNKKQFPLIADAPSTSNDDFLYEFDFLTDIGTTQGVTDYLEVIGDSLDPTDEMVCVFTGLPDWSTATVLLHGQPLTSTPQLPNLFLLPETGFHYDATNDQLWLRFFGVQDETEGDVLEIRW